jgi:hypothetical protein
MVKLSDYFTKHGINDAPRGVLYYKVLGGLTFIGTVGLCYRYKPMSKLLMWSLRQYQGLASIISFKGVVHTCSQNLKRASGQLKEKYPEAFERTQETFEPLRTKGPIIGTELSKSNFFGMNYRTLALAFAIVEGTLFYKLSSPVMIPLKFWIVSRLLRNHDHKLSWRASIEDTVGVLLCVKE